MTLLWLDIKQLHWYWRRADSRMTKYKMKWRSLIDFKWKRAESHQVWFQCWHLTLDDDDSIMHGDDDEDKDSWSRAECARPMCGVCLLNFWPQTLLHLSSHHCNLRLHCSFYILHLLHIHSPLHYSAPVKSTSPALNALQWSNLYWTEMYRSFALLCSSSILDQFQISTTVFFMQCRHCVCICICVCFSICICIDICICKLQEMHCSVEADPWCAGTALVRSDW